MIAAIHAQDHAVQNHAAQNHVLDHVQDHVLQLQFVSQFATKRHYERKDVPFSRTYKINKCLNE